MRLMTKPDEEPVSIEETIRDGRAVVADLQDAVDRMARLLDNAERNHHSRSTDGNN